MEDTPAPASQQNCGRRVTPPIEALRIDAAELLTAVSHCEEQWRGECGDKLLEMALTELRFGFRTKAQHAVVLGKQAGNQHMVDNCRCRRSIHVLKHVLEPHTVAPCYAPLLKRQAHDLLCKNVG